MWLVVGLGNPGLKYQHTRHNIGFMVINHWLKNLSPLQITSKQEYQSHTYHIKLKEKHIILCLPLTYMNLSGLAVKPLLSYYKISLEHLLVIHDEMDLPFGVCKFQKNRGAALHNGVEHIHKELNSQNYMRLRVGIDKPQNKSLAKNYVLNDFTHNEKEKLPALMTYMQAGLENIFILDFDKVANKYNLKKPLWENDFFHLK